MTAMPLCLPVGACGCRGRRPQDADDVETLEDAGAVEAEPVAEAPAPVGGAGEVDALRQQVSVSNGTFQLNTWIPDPAPIRDLQHEKEI